VKITDQCDSCPGQLLRYMFEEEDHAIYELLFAMMITYKNLGNTLRSHHSSNSNQNSNQHSDSDSDSDSE
jgi:hypothetical protein